MEHYGYYELKTTFPGGSRRTHHNRDIIRTTKEQPCADCGVRYPSYVMDFDHVWGTKVEKVSDMALGSTEKLQEEISKCEVVCANCHRERTYQRGVDKPLPIV